MSIKAVIFDFGGVLVRTEDHAGRRKWDQQLGLPPGDVDRAVFETEMAAKATVGQASVDELWANVAQILELDSQQMADFQRDFWGGDSLDLTLVGYLRGLRPEVKTAILSNAWDNARELFVQEFSLGDVFDELIISAEEGVAKPDPRIYLLALERLDVQPNEAVFVDDMERNVEAARAVGMWAIHFTSQEQTLRQLEELLNADS